MKITILISLLAASLSAGTYNHDANLAEECRIRDGLPNVMAKLNSGKSVRIAYLGGSITAAKGWRPKTMAWFKKTFPKSEIVEINPAISGTGSDYSACRLEEDVLSEKPDLIFLECRVNGGGGYEYKSVEGVVRHTWKSNPNIDICFVYTINQRMLKPIQAGKNTRFGTVMETIANAYGIPTIDMGVEIAKREKAGSLIFKANAPVEGKLVFSKDGTHPGSEGHDVYCEVVGRSIMKMADKNQAVAHAVPAALKPNSWEVATLLPIEKVQKSEGWTKVDVKKDPVYTESRWRTDAMLRGAVKCSRAGESITVKWKGTVVGISDIPHGEPPLLEAVIDGGKPITSRRKMRETTKYSRFWYIPEQPYGEHTAVFTVKELKEGQSFYFGQVLVVGEPME